MIEAVITEWLGSLSAPLYAVVVPKNQTTPAIVYSIESEFIPTDDEAPYGAKGHNVRISIWHASYKEASAIADSVRAALNFYRTGYLVSVDDRGDYKDDDTLEYGIVLDAQITVLNQSVEPQQSGLREAVKQELINNTSCNDRIFASRIGFANCNGYPCAGIFIRDTEISTGNADQKRKAELIVNIKTVSSLTSENELELIVSQVELMLNPDAKIFNESRIDIERINTEYSDIGRLHYEHRLIQFSVEYYQNIIESDGINLFNIANADWNIDEDLVAEAQDELTIPQD
jgi:hypothetical protein